MRRRDGCCFSNALRVQLIPVILLIWVAGCASLASSEMATPPTVAVLVNRTWVEEDSRGFVWERRQEERVVEEQFAACVKSAASVRKFALRVMTGSDFRAAVFPDLDARAAPRRIETLRSLIPDPRFRERIEAARIDYLAIVGGETRTSETQGGVGCAGGYGGGGCFGLLWWDHQSRLSALIVDLRARLEQLSEGVEASGVSWFAIFAVLPFAMPSVHEAIGCERFGHAVTAVLAEKIHQGD